MADPIVAHLKERIACLEEELRSRPTNDQVKYVTDYAERRERLYEAVLARNVVLRRKLEDTGRTT
jgi:hypothetical protein